MGNSFSSSARKYQLLIGDLNDDLPANELKLYHLSQFILSPDDSSVGTVSQPLDCVVVGKYTNPHECEKTINRNAEASTSDVKTDIEVNSQLDATDLQEDKILTLFSLLISNKPFFFSQTFTQWKSVYRISQMCPPVCGRVEKRVIYLQPVDSFPSFITDYHIDMPECGGTHDFFSLLQKFMEAYFDGMSVRLLPNVNVLEAKWNIKTRNHHKTGSKQYFVQNFFPKLKKIKPRDGYCVMGMVWTDLYPTEQLNFVLGEAHFTFKSGIFCFGRCEPKTYDPDAFKDLTELNAMLMWRILKVISHETCHLFGLQHCWYFHCTMNESSSMTEAASQPLFLCPVCLRKLQHACDFRVLHRYKRLLSILRDIGAAFPSENFRNSVRWLEKCVQFMESND